MTCMACLSFSSIKTYAFSASELHLLTDISSTQMENFPIKTLISSYCTQVLASPPFKENDDKFLYNAKQSAFVHLLCRNMGIDSPYFKDEEKKYFKHLSFVELWFQDIPSTDPSQTDLCAIDSFQNDCDLSVNIPKLFNGIMNDYISMKQPNLYGMNANFGSGEDKIIQQINLFSSGYFDGVQMCGDDNPRYPKTCQMMKWYIRNLRNVLNDVTIFNTSGILDMTDMSNISCATIFLTWDIFYCGLYGDTWTSLTSFVNLVYNELLYYRLFMWYYLSMLQKYPTLLAKNTYMTSYPNISKTFSTQYMRSKDALSLSLRMMRDIYVAFPFHVGFSMYQESLDGFWKSLARIAPPIYTLYDKLRNVQKPQ